MPIRKWPALAARPDTSSLKPLTEAQFSRRLESFSDLLSDQTDIAVALSGGGDSMALSLMLSRWAAQHGKTLHALTVNHGLRPEAAAEAKQVASWVKPWGIVHKILTWTGDKPSTRIQEEARAARYRLMATYCQKNKISLLFLAHHANDQAETILFRLAKGSGLDGLAGMSDRQDFSSKLTLLRPVLDVTHEQLLATCRAAKIEWVEDKSNVSDRYARIRLRKSMDVLEAEGLSVKRVLSLGLRLERARSALEQVTDPAWEKCVIEYNSKLIVFNYKDLLVYPEEIVLRCVMRAIQHFRAGRAYPPRLESLEDLVAKLVSQTTPFKAATLGGCVIRVQNKKGLVTIQPEVTK